MHYGSDKTSARRTVEQITDAGGRAFPVLAPFGVPHDIRTLYERFDAGLEELGEPIALDILVDNGGFNISSAATRVSFPSSLAYSMAKSALDALTRTLAKELGARQITVNSVAPGFVKTDPATVLTTSPVPLHSLTRTLKRGQLDASPT